MTISISAADLASLTAGKPVAIVGPTVTPPTPSNPTQLGVQVLNGKLCNLAGTPIRMKGVNISGPEFVAIQGWSPKDILGGQITGQTALTINWAAIKAWIPAALQPVVRLPYNAASLLAQTTYDYSGASRLADPGQDYLSQYTQMVAQAIAAGFIVIGDMHWSAPNMVTPGSATARPFSPMTQGPAPDPINSIAAITLLGKTFKNQPAFMCDLFNEWMLDQYGGAPGMNVWQTWLNGGTCVKFPNNTSGGANYDFGQTTQTAGMQQMLDAFRATGAPNVCIAGGANWGSDDGGWLANLIIDPLKQLMVSTHEYPSVAYGATGYATLNMIRLNQIAAIQAAGYPAIFGEVGGYNVAGTASEPFTSAVIAYAAANNVSYVGWAWDVWQNSTNVLIKDGNGTPTDGFGTVFKAGT
jgi:endoglucanase